MTSFFSSLGSKISAENAECYHNQNTDLAQKMVWLVCGSRKSAVLTIYGHFRHYLKKTAKYSHFKVVEKLSLTKNNILWKLRKTFSGRF